MMTWKNLKYSEIITSGNYTVEKPTRDTENQLQKITQEM